MGNWAVIIVKNGQVSPNSDLPVVSICRREIIHEPFGKALVFGAMGILWPKIQPRPHADVSFLQLFIPMSHKLFDCCGAVLVAGFAKHVDEYLRYAAPREDIRPWVNQGLTC